MVIIAGGEASNAASIAILFFEGYSFCLKICDHFTAG